MQNPRSRPSLTHPGDGAATPSLPWRRVGDELLIDIIVSPRASQEKLGPVHGDRLKVFVHAPPVEGEANAAIIALFAKQLRLAAREVALVAGEGSRRKTVRVPASDATAARLAALAAPR